ncbi:MAG: tetratricopeptide repeat protein [Candidatus Liptonbacteria bacterium]|nr:tetratricopeptide repeat protein [Candidatus Liptonbacteria bacterium]
MNPEIKKIIAVSVTILIVIIAYYGTYLPMRKSMVFIDTMQLSGRVRTITDFENVFSVPLDYPSPVGQEELVRSVANTVANNVKNISDPRGVEELIGFIEKYYNPIIERGRGMSFGQDVYIMGMMNEFAYLQTREPKYLQNAERYFKQEQALGPKRPQSLYGLMDVYRLEGNVDEFKKIAEQVLRQWPNDARTKTFIEEMTENSSGTKTQ